MNLSAEMVIKIKFDVEVTDLPKEIKDLIISKIKLKFNEGKTAKLNLEKERCFQVEDDPTQ